MKPFHRALPLTTLLLTLAATPVALFAQQGRGPHGGQHGGQHGGPQGGFGHGFMMDRMADRLELTDAQREQIQVIQESHREQTADLTTAASEARRALNDAIHAEPFDEVAIRDAAARLAELEADLAVHRARMMGEVRQILTPEQAEKARQMRESFQERDGDWRSRRGSGQRWGRPDNDND